MPFKSQAQMRKFFELEKQGQLPKGTAQQWADETPNIKSLPERIGNTGGKSMARMSYNQRKNLPKSDFALPEKKTKANPAGKGAYPINDLPRARNALSMVSRFGTPAVKATVRSKVKAKYPSIGRPKAPPKKKGMGMMKKSALWG